MAIRIAFLCKRRYMGKDVILDRYARLYEIPRQLALLGHEVRAFCLDYHGAQADIAGPWEHETASGSLSWASESVRRWRLPRLALYPQHMLNQLRVFRPQVLVGASDIPHVALTGWLAKRLDLPYAVDLYDNFEGFGQARIPGFVPALRKATRNASLVVTTSEPLRQMVLKDYGAKGQVVSMPSSVDLQVFCRGNKSEARRRLGLPEDLVLIGTAGGLHKDKGVEPLYRAWASIAARHPTARLVLAGPYRPELPPPQGDRVHYLGHLDHAQVADLFRALDVGVISILDTPFGRYCFPQKAYEMLACGLSVVVANIGEMSALFAPTPQIMFPPGDAEGLARALEHQLSMPVDSRIPVQGWPDLIAGIEPILLRMSAQSTASGRS